MARAKRQHRNRKVVSTSEPERRRALPYKQLFLSAIAENSQRREWGLESFVDKAVERSNEIGTKTGPRMKSQFRKTALLLEHTGKSEIRYDGHMKFRLKSFVFNEIKQFLDVGDGDDETSKERAQRQRRLLPRLAKAMFPCPLEYSHEQRIAEKEAAMEAAAGSSDEHHDTSVEERDMDSHYEADDTLVNDQAGFFESNEASTSRRVLEGFHSSTPNKSNTQTQLSYPSPTSLPRPVQPHHSINFVDDAPFADPDNDMMMDLVDDIPEPSRAELGVCCDAAGQLPQLQAELAGFKETHAEMVEDLARDLYLAGGREATFEQGMEVAQAEATAAGSALDLREEVTGMRATIAGVFNGGMNFFENMKNNFGRYVPPNSTSS